VVSLTHFTEKDVSGRGPQQTDFFGKYLPTKEWHGTVISENFLIFFFRLWLLNSTGWDEWYSRFNAGVSGTYRTVICML
jgi:hypothetical protein